MQAPKDIIWLERTLHALEGNTDEVLLSQYECNCTVVVRSNAMG